MIAASLPEQRAANAKILAVDRAGRLRHWPRRDVARLFDAGDLVIANDAATIPASLTGQHLRSGRRIEARLAGRESLDVDRVTSFTAVLFGLGDFRMRTEDRPPPPQVEPGDRLAFGPLRATVTRRLFDHPRLVVIEFEGPPAAIWEGLARHGKPIQYAHVRQPLALWDTWTPIAGVPVAFEPPSASFALDWQTLASMRATTCSLRHDHARGGTIVDGGSGPRRAAAVRRTLRNTGAHYVGAAARARRGPAHRGDRHDGRAGTRACRRTRRHRPRGRRASRPNASVRPRTSASSTPSCRARTSRARATMRS